jgi:hypothetical protein
MAKTTTVKWTAGVAYMVEGLLCKHEALSSNPNLTQKKSTIDVEKKFATHEQKHEHAQGTEHSHTPHQQDPTEAWTKGETDVSPRK